MVLAVPNPNPKPESRSGYSFSDVNSSSSVWHRNENRGRIWDESLRTVGAIVDRLASSMAPGWEARRAWR